MLLGRQIAAATHEPEQRTLAEPAKYVGQHFIDDFVTAPMHNVIAEVRHSLNDRKCMLQSGVRALQDKGKSLGNVTGSPAYVFGEN